MNKLPEVDDEGKLERLGKPPNAPPTEVDWPSDEVELDVRNGSNELEFRVGIFESNDLNPNESSVRLALKLDPFEDDTPEPLLNDVIFLSWAIRFQYALSNSNCCFRFLEFNLSLSNCF